MNDLIKINNNSDRPTVMGRELHEALGINSNYTTWFKRMCEYGFTENSDFVTLSKIGKRADGTEMPIPTIDHQITIDMAKEICMIQRSEKGKQFRQYFIDVERKWNSPEAVMARALQLANKQLESVREINLQLEQKIEQDKPLVDFANQVRNIDGLVDLQQFAKIMQEENIKIGRNKMFEWFRENRYLIAEGNHMNEPYQHYINQGLFAVKEGFYKMPDGTKEPYFKTFLTGKGQIYFCKKLKESFGKGRI